MSEDHECEECWCEFCAEHFDMTGERRVAWERCEWEDSDFSTEDGDQMWTFAKPRRVIAERKSCNCWLIVVDEDEPTLCSAHRQAEPDCPQCVVPKFLVAGGVKP